MSLQDETFRSIAILQSLCTIPLMQWIWTISMIGSRTGSPNNEDVEADLGEQDKQVELTDDYAEDVLNRQEYVSKEPEAISYH
jgi:hypothetical protein